MRKRRKDDLRFVQGSIFGGDIRHLSGSDARALSALLVGRRKRELQVRVSRDQAAQLPSRVAAGTQYSDRNFMHNECITLHSLRVNDPVFPLARHAFWC